MREGAYGEPDKIRGDKYIYYCDEDKSIGLVFEIENNKSMRSRWAIWTDSLLR